MTDEVWDTYLYLRPEDLTWLVADLVKTTSNSFACSNSADELKMVKSLDKMIYHKQNCHIV